MQSFRFLESDFYAENKMWELKTNLNFTVKLQNQTLNLKSKFNSKIQIGNFILLSS